MPGHHLGRPLSLARITVTGFRRFLILFFFFFKKCQSCAQHTWVISKHDRGDRSVLFGAGGWGREKARTTTRHGLGPRAEHLRGWAGSAGSVGGPREGRSGTTSHAPHTAWHARPAPPAVTRLTCPCSPHCALGAPEAQVRPHTNSPGGAEGTAQQRARHILPVLQTQRRQEREQRGGAGGARTPPRTPASCLCYWARDLATPGQREGKDRQMARASNSFCLELDSSVLAGGKWFSIVSIIFFFFKYIFVKVIPSCFSGEICLMDKMCLFS